MSMDDQERALRDFDRQLTRFDELLLARLRELERAREQVEPLWRDEFRGEFDAVWLPLHEALRVYFDREGPAYRRFLAEKRKHLRRYLDG